MGGFFQIVKTFASMLLSPFFTLIILAAYFVLLLCIARLALRRADSDGFYCGSRRTPWYVIAAGMVGSSVSGVSFISVTGMPAQHGFSYMQMALGFVVGYIAVSQVLLPLYYRLNLVSIYGYLRLRFGVPAYKTAAALFILSRLLLSAVRLLVVAEVLQRLLFERLGVPFYLNVLISVFFIFIYTHRGGIRVIIWTDLLQTFVMIAAAVLTLWCTADALGLSFSGVIRVVSSSPFSRVFFFDDVGSAHYFWKEFFAGAFTVLAMTGLDQDLMQKNLSYRTLQQAQRGMRWYGLAFLPVNLLFLTLGVLFLTLMQKHGIAMPVSSDGIYPMLIADGWLPAVAVVFFVLGITAATYSSADSALTALTTSFCLDILDFQREDVFLQSKRRLVHMALSVCLVVLALLFHAQRGGALIGVVYFISGYTYGPLLGLFLFGLLTRFVPSGVWIPFAAVLSPCLTYVVSWAAQWWFAYTFGFEILILNASLMFLLLLFLSALKRFFSTS